MIFWGPNDVAVKIQHDSLNAQGGLSKGLLHGTVQPVLGLLHVVRAAIYSLRKTVANAKTYLISVHEPRGNCCRKHLIQKLKHAVRGEEIADTSKTDNTRMLFRPQPSS